MASTLDLVLRNFAWRIEAITPTSSLEPGLRFVEMDPARQDEATLRQRHFAVIHQGTGPDGELRDGSKMSCTRSERVAVHAIDVEVYYRPELTHRKASDLAARDRHDIVKVLRGDNGDGYDDDNPSTDIGIWDRILESEEFETDASGVRTLRLSWSCTVHETET